MISARSREHSNDDEDEGTAVFISTMLNVPYVFAMYGPFQDSPVEQSSARIARILGADWIPIMRGVELLLRSCYDKIKDSP
jgi:hypothetical protein